MAKQARPSSHLDRVIHVLLALLAACPLLAADKSGVSPNTISLPKGPGSIEGLGESFQPTLNTGTAKYALGLKLPPGTAGQTPDLRLVYEGGSGNGPLGFGWQLPVAWIQRRSDHGIPTYGDDVGFVRQDTFINENREELVPVADGSYFCKNESAFVRYRQVADHWEGTLSDGTRLEFGLSEAGRVQADTNHVFSWLLERETDTHGNVIAYSYAAGPGDPNLNQKYLTTIRYGPGAPPRANYHFVVLRYEGRSDWFEDCRPGFPVRTGQRLKSIIVGTHGPLLSGHAHEDYDGDGELDNLDRRYELDYLDYAGTNSHWSLLARVTLVGTDGVTALPPTTFGYAVCNPPDTLSATHQIIGGVNEPPFVMDSSLVDLVDLNGDGLPDILKTDFGVPGYHQVYLNQGEALTNGVRTLRWSDAQEVMSESGDAWNFGLDAASTHLADMDGDGLADLVHRTALDEVFYFRNAGRAAWSERVPMSAQAFPPPAPFGEVNVRTADLDFDKRTDLIRGDGFEYQIWYNFGANQYSDRVTVPHTDAFDFASPAVQIADLNGDRVPDIARIWPTGVEITAGLGYGRFVPSQFMKIPDWTLDAAQAQRAKLTDLNGDGLADLVIERAAPGELWFWLNLGNYTFAPRGQILDLPLTVGANAAIRWADLDGNGTTDIIYADSETSPRIMAVDVGQLLTPGGIPNALTVITNGIGRVTRIGYEPSTRFALEDAAAGNPWPDPMPFPVQVVSSVTNLDSLGHQYVSQFRYHDGYYDPVEKQFRGFARVEQVDVGDASAPTLITRSHFDTGRDYEAMKGKVLRLTTEQEDGRAFTDETTAWTTPPVTLYTGTNGTNVVYAHPSGTVRLVKELGIGIERRLETETDFDAYGNQTRNADYGMVENGDRSAFDDQRIVTTEYTINTNAWILRLPTREEIIDENGGVISRTEFFYDDESFTGNNHGLVTIGNLTMKREWRDPTDPSAYITSTRTKYDGYGNPATILDPLAVAPGGTVDFSTGHAREIQYDPDFQAYPIKETIHIGEGGLGVPTEPLVFQAAYDAGFGTVTSSTDFNDNRTDYGYDALARLTSIVKPGDSPAYPTVEYDYALAVPFPLPLGEGQGEGLVNYVETRQRDKSEIRNPKSEMYFISREFVDGLGRKLMTKTEAEPAPGTTAPRVVVSEATQFNARQQPVRVLNPYFVVGRGVPTAPLDDLLAFEDIEAPGWQGQFHNEGGLVTLDLASAHATRTDYDATLRSTQVTNPDGTSRRTVYEPFLTRSFDENQTDTNSAYFGDSMVHYNDGLGRLIQVDENTRLSDDGLPLAADPSAVDPLAWTTRYEYDLNDHLTRITDSQNNVKTFTYDGLKRKTDMNDPDRGVMHFIYDDASNLSETTDAKNQRITYTYDGANRIRTEQYHDGLPLPPWRTLAPSGGEGRGEGATNSVIYHYDTPFPNLPQGDNTLATARNVKGALAWVEDLSGEEHTSYDSRGRVESVVKRIPDPQFLSLAPTGGEGQGEGAIGVGLVFYKTTFAYDSLDRLTNLTYPDADQLRYEYNDRNLLQRIPGGPLGGQPLAGSIIAGIAYQPSAQMGQIDYGNGVRTTYAYDSRLRLKRLHTLSPTGGEGQGEGADLIHFLYDFDGVSNIKSIADLRPGSAVPEGDPRRNTQLFRYDDLYRLTRVQYSFAVPTGSPLPLGEGSGVRVDGEINYRYDRIGNMLAQTSTLDHQEKGLPVANLGDMESGGNMGRNGRIGRSPTDPPGPHALTRISNPQLQIADRLYGYDPNGNMTNIDRLVCAWDFKDRLVAVENSEMRAAYTYDYTDRRILKQVWPKNSLSASGGEGRGEVAPTTVSYINKYFEVREHDAPTKYVWNGNTRVARVTGSLNTNVRVQRLRLWPGWNLCSLAVSSPTPLWGEGRGEVLSAAFRWNPATLGWDEVLPSDSLPAGTVLWLKASTNATLTVIGAYSDPTNRIVPAGGDFLPSAGLEDWNFKAAISNLPAATAWTYDAFSTRWLSWLPPPLELSSDPPAFIAPGEAVFVRADDPAQLEVPDSALRIRYYHQDHLRSSSCLSDAQGGLVEELTSYPFGGARHGRQRTGIQEHYRYVQKETDSETGLQCFAARFYLGNVARFVRVDPLSLEPTSDFLSGPQHLNPLSYGLNNPIVMMDPSGLAPTSFGVDMDYKETPAANFVSSSADWYTAKASQMVENDPSRLGFTKASLVLSVGIGLEFGKEMISMDSMEKDIRTLGSSQASWGQRGTAGAKLAWDFGAEKILKVANTVDRLAHFSSMQKAANRGVGALIEQTKFWLKGDRMKQSAVFVKNLQAIEKFEKVREAIEKTDTAVERWTSVLKSTSSTAGSAAKSPDVIDIVIEARPEDFRGRK